MVSQNTETISISAFTKDPFFGYDLGANMRPTSSLHTQVYPFLLSSAVAWALGLGALRAAPTPPTDLPKVVTAPWALEGNYKPTRSEAVPDWQPPHLDETPPPPPLSAEHRELLLATKQEKLPEPTWARYVMSNEWRHDVLFPKLAGLSGVFIGVATDQNYTMAAAARAALLVTVDYDSDVVFTHRIYHHFIRVSPTAQDLLSFYASSGQPKALALLSQVASSKEEETRLHKTYLRYRERLAIYLHQVAKLRVFDRKPTWLGDPAAYGYIRSLVLGGRVLAVQGDLNGAVTLRSIGDTARALKLPVRVIYTSNAEGFFQYGQAIKDNLAALPHDEKTVVVRTYKRGMTAPLGDLWHYNVHKLDDFLLRSMTPGYSNVAAIMSDLRKTPLGRKRIEPLGVSYLDEGIPITTPPALPGAAKKPSDKTPEKGAVSVASQLGSATLANK